MSNVIMDYKWLTLHVYSGQEHKVKLNLESEIKRVGLEEKIREVLVPDEDVVEMRNGKKKVKKKAFYPGYILINLVLDKETQHFIQNFPGVINFLSIKYKPLEIQPREIERIKKQISDKEEREKIEAPFTVGDTIKVIDGPFNDFSGFVEEINMEKSKVKVMVSIFGRPTPVELDFLQVKMEK